MREGETAPLNRASNTSGVNKGGCGDGKESVTYRGMDQVDNHRRIWTASLLTVHKEGWVF